MNHRQTPGAGVRYMLAGGSVVAAFGMLIDPSGLLPNFAPQKDVCQEIVQSKAVLSRDQLTRVLSIPRGTNKEQVQQVAKGPYCKLQPAQGAKNTQSEAYPLAFDPQTWFVLVYEGDQYAGYSFSFRH